MTLGDKKQGTVPYQCAMFSSFLPYHSKVECINAHQLCLTGSPPISIGCDWQTLLKIRNPPENFCKAWSEDHLCPLW